MTPVNPRLAFAVSILAGDVPLEGRAAAARARGYRAVESWWPWPMPDPDDETVDGFVASIEEAGVQLSLMNLWGGSASGAAGVLGIRAAEAEYGRHASRVLELAGRLGIDNVHALAGNRGDGADAAVAAERVLRLADAMPDCSGVVIEPLNALDRPDYLFNDPFAARDVIADLFERSGGRVGMLADTYQLAKSGVDPVDYIRDSSALIRHVQFADFPGRGRPGTGSVDFGGALRALEAASYGGWIGLEYVPDGRVPAPDEIWETLWQTKHP